MRLLCFLLGVLGLCVVAVAQPANRPNIILILTDDMGYGDLSGYGSTANHTPNLDALMSRGTRFSRCYAGSAVCTPSRASLLTGKFPLRYDIRWAFGDNDEFLPVESNNLPNLLQRAGYATAHIGKWHLGGLRITDFEARSNRKPANPGPLQHGFSHYLANIEDPLVRQDLIKNRQLYRQGGQTMVRNDGRVPPTAGNWETLKVDEALAFIGQTHRTKTPKKPFFINLWFDTPHTPYEPIEPFVGELAKQGATGDQLLFRSMMKHLDTQVGRLVAELDKRGLMKNTLIIFGSDNGGAFQSSPGPFAGHKTDLHDGGLRVPFFVVWEGKIPRNGYSFQRVHYADLLPTLCDMLSIANPVRDNDGQSVWPQWQGKPDMPHRTMLWQLDVTPKTQYQGQGVRPQPVGSYAALRGNWKLIATDEKPVALYEVENQYREQTNVLGTQPAIEQELWNEIQTFRDAKRTSWKTANAPKP